MTEREEPQLTTVYVPLGEVELATGGVKTSLGVDEAGNHKIVFAYPVDKNSENPPEVQKKMIKMMEDTLGEALSTKIPDQLEKDIEEGKRRGIVYPIVGGVVLLVAATAAVIEYGRHGEEIKNFLQREDVRELIDRFRRQKSN